MRSSSLRRSLVVVLPALAAAFVTGCFNSPDKSKLSCTTNDHCPHGEICVGVNGTVPGICGKPIDGGGVDASPALDGASVMDSGAASIDSSPAIEVASAIDASSAPIDSANDHGANDAPPVVDTASASDDSDVPLDTAKDGGVLDQTMTGSNDGPVVGPDVVTATDVPIQNPEAGGACAIATD